MAVPASTICRGFTNPIVLLVRSSLHSSRAELHFIDTTAWARSRVSSRTSTARFASFKAQPFANKKPNPAAKTIPFNASRSAQAASDASPQVGYAQTLASKSSPTTLYEGGSQRIFLFSSYAAGVTLFGAAAINAILNVYDLPEGVPGYVAYPFGFISLMMGALGAKFAMNPSGVVRTIKVLPMVASKAASSTTAGAARQVPATSRPQIEFRVRRTTPLPGLPLQTIVCEPHEIVLKARMYSKPTVSSAQELAKSKLEKEAKKQAELAYEKTHIMSAPFRHGWWAIKAGFANIRQGITGEGFAPIEVKGIKYKLDITDAYALEEGRALDRIAQIDESPGIASLRAERMRQLLS